MTADLQLHRLQRSRAKGWRMPQGTVYVGRPTMWGNPWVVGSPGLLDLDGIRWILPRDLDAKLAARQFYGLLRGWPINHLILPIYSTGQLRDHHHALLRDRCNLVLNNIKALRGKHLACWCKPGTDCHADVLLKLANS